MRFTESNISRLELADGERRRTFTDPGHPGLQLDVLKKCKTFRFRHRVGERQVSIKIGQFPKVSLEEARNRARELREGLARGTGEDIAQGAAHGITIAEFFEKHYLPHARRHKKSWRLDEMNFRLHLAEWVGALEMGKIRPSHVHDIMERMRARGASNGLINHVVVLLGALYSLANKWKFEGIPERRDLAIRLLPNPRKIARYLSRDESERLFVELDRSGNPLLKYIVTFLLLTGARRSEALLAKWADFDIENMIWTIPENKSGQPRAVVVSKNVAALLRHCARIQKAHWDGRMSAYVFPNLRTGFPYTNIYRSWNHARCRAGLRDVRMHDLRHSFASALVNNGVSIYEVQNLLGHRSINTTRRYAHLSPGRLRESAEVAGEVYDLAARIS